MVKSKENKDKLISLRISEKTYESAEHFAKKKGLKVTAYIRTCLEEKVSSEWTKLLMSAALTPEQIAESKKKDHVYIGMTKTSELFDDSIESHNIFNLYIKGTEEKGSRIADLLIKTKQELTAIELKQWYECNQMEIYKDGSKIFIKEKNK